jgi:hypothetical protein
MTMGDSFSDFLDSDSLFFSDEWPYVSDITVDYLSEDPIFEETALSFNDAEIGDLATNLDMEMDHFWTLEDNDEHTISSDDCLSPSTTIGSTLRKRQDMCGTLPWVEDDLASEDLTTEEVEDYWCSATSKFGVTNIPVCNDDENLKALNPYGTEMWNLEGALFGSMTLFKCRLSKPSIYTYYSYLCLQIVN